MAEIVLVKQDEKFGCGIAVIATVLNKTYDEVRFDFGNDFERRGMFFHQILDYLGDFGYSIVEKKIRNWNTKDFAKKEMLRPFAPVHIVSVKQFFDGNKSHVVVMTDKGKILCPNGATDKQIRECYLVDQIAGLYK